jgi:aminoglycoside/choline kinase family phosphotransferase
MRPPCRGLSIFERGFAIIEDLGRNVYGRMMLAGENMTRAHEEKRSRCWPTWRESTWPVRRCRSPAMRPICVPRYDVEAQLIEVDLLASAGSGRMSMAREIPQAASCGELETLWT